jgi:hypothetical protein
MRRRLETPKKTFKRCNSPLNCTSSHFIRNIFGHKQYATRFFNEINNLALFFQTASALKTVLNEALSRINECVARIGNWLEQTTHAVVKVRVPSRNSHFWQHDRMICSGRKGEFFLPDEARDLCQPKYIKTGQKARVSYQKGDYAQWLRARAAIQLIAIALEVWQWCVAAIPAEARSAEVW